MAAIVACAQAAPGLLAAAPLVAGPAIVRAAPVVAGPAIIKTEPVDALPQYSFGYNVHDAITGDSKTQEESRLGDVVRGSYSLIEADGSRRIVNYYADPINGFNAVVQKDLPLVAAAPVVAARAVLPAAPLLAKTILA